MLNVTITARRGMRPGLMCLKSTLCGTRRGYNPHCGLVIDAVCALFVMPVPMGAKRNCAITFNQCAI